MTLDIEKLAREAEKIADDKTQSPGEFHPDWSDERNKAFAALVLEQAAQKCDETYYRNIGPSLGEVRYGVVTCADAIRAMKPKAE